MYHEQQCSALVLLAVRVPFRVTYVNDTCRIWELSLSHLELPLNSSSKTHKEAMTRQRWSENEKFLTISRNLRDEAQESIPTANAVLFFSSFSSSSPQTPCAASPLRCQPLFFIYERHLLGISGPTLAASSHYPGLPLPSTEPGISFPHAQ